MDEKDMIDKLSELLAFAGESWPQEPNKGDLFKLFRQASKDTTRPPALDGDRLKELISSRIDSNSRDYKEIEEAVVDFCYAWDEWKYALEHWRRD